MCDSLPILTWDHVVEWTRLEDVFGVEGFAEKLLHVSSGQEDGGHHSHQHPREDDGESNAAVEKRCRGRLQQ